MLFIEQILCFQHCNSLRGDESWSALIVEGDGFKKDPENIILIFQLLITAMKKVI